MSWQEVVKLLGDISYADLQNVVNTLEENGVHAMSNEGDADFYADNETEQHSVVSLENRELETDFILGTLIFFNRLVANIFQSSARSFTIFDSLSTTYNTSPRNLRTTLKISTSSTQTSQTKKWASCMKCKLTPRMLTITKNSMCAKPVKSSLSNRNRISSSRDNDPAGFP